MTTDLSRKSKYVIINSMCCLLKALEGKRITVDIRNNTVIYGLLNSIEGTMSLNMTSVTLTDVIGRKTHLSKFYVHGRQIVYVHIPDEVNIIEAMNWQLSRKSVHQEKERQWKDQMFHQKQRRKDLARQKMDRKMEREKLAEQNTSDQ